LPSWELITSSW